MEIFRCDFSLTTTTTLQYNTPAMIEPVIEELTKAINAQTAVLKESIEVGRALLAGGVTPAPPKAKPKGKVPVETPKDDPPAEETAKEPAATEQDFPTDRQAALTKVTEVFKAKLTAADASDREAMKARFAEVRKEFEVETIHKLTDEQIKPFYDAMVEKV